MTLTSNPNDSDARRMMAGLFATQSAAVTALPLTSYIYPHRTEPANLIYLCKTAGENETTMPIDKMGRWYGFVLACLGVYGPSVFDVDRLRKDIHGRSEVLGDVGGTPSLHDAHDRLFERYGSLCDRAGELPRPAQASTSAEHLKLLCRMPGRALLAKAVDMGFVQGALVFHQLVTVDDEREHTRSIFHAAYEEAGLTIPDTFSHNPRVFL